MNSLFADQEDVSFSMMCPSGFACSSAKESVIRMVAYRICTESKTETRILQDASPVNVATAALTLLFLPH